MQFFARQHWRSCSQVVRVSPQAFVVRTEQWRNNIWSIPVEGEGGSTFPFAFACQITVGLQAIMPTSASQCGKTGDNHCVN